MDVVVVGAGPAGAALAHLLASRGVEVTLLERQRAFEREFRGEVLMPSGVHALEQIGLEGLDEIPQRCPTSVEAFANGRSFFRREETQPTINGRSRAARYGCSAYSPALVSYC